jgi:hypothetical protein
VSYTFENPTSFLATIDVDFEPSRECGFAGPKCFRLNLLAFTAYEVKLIVLPIKDEWVKLPRLVALDEQKRLLEVLRVTDELKIEGPDLFLRIPSSK